MATDCIEISKIMNKYINIQLLQNRIQKIIITESNIIVASHIYNIRIVNYNLKPYHNHALHS